MIIYPMIDIDGVAHDHRALKDGGYVGPYGKPPNDLNWWWVYA